MGVPWRRCLRKIRPATLLRLTLDPSSYPWVTLRTQVRHSMNPGNGDPRILESQMRYVTTAEPDIPNLLDSKMAKNS